MYYSVSSNLKKNFSPALIPEMYRYLPVMYFNVYSSMVINISMCVPPWLQCKSSDDKKKLLLGETNVYILYVISHTFLFFQSRDSDFLHHCRCSKLLMLQNFAKFFFFVQNFAVFINSLYLLVISIRLYLRSHKCAQT